ncbi:MAG TPA: transglutaminase family protein [Abditibacteriaceae bacterium]|jgi:hypothetical protein
MIITTLHETMWNYEQPIRGTFTEARLCPMSDASQTCREWSVSVDPLRPMSESIDYFGNLVISFNILPPHKCVVVTGHSVVETHRNPFAPTPVDTFDESRARMDYLSFDGPVEEHVEVERLAELCEISDARNRSPFDSLACFQKLNAAIWEEFLYSPDATDVHTKIGEVFEAKAGVCQDFAHIFIAVCRAAGIPARYVSGYLVTRRSRSAAGSPASHAWCEALVPGLGWRAFDPTNNLLADDYFIKLAVGRDYRDVPPTRGVYSGRAASLLRVRVHTMVHEDSVAAQMEAPLRDEHHEDSRHHVAPRELQG